MKLPTKPGKSIFYWLLCAILIAPALSAAQSGDIEVCLYSERNFQGAEYCSNTDSSFVPFRFDSASIKVPRRYLVKLYSLPFYLGQPVVLERSVSAFVGLTNGVRSFKIEKLPAGQNSTAAAMVSVLGLLLDEKIDPDDLDGDGFSNELEERYGTDPNDRNSTPPDIDGDKIPDDVDPDRDGDGVSNDDEIAAGTDPNDPDDYPDTTAPTLIVTPPASLRTTVANINVFGNVLDPVQPYSGIADLYIASGAFPGILFRGNLSSDTGEFSIEVALKNGSNDLTIVALDNSGNRSQSSLPILRVSVPTILSLVPATGTISATDRVDISGDIQTTLPADSFVFTINDSRVLTTSTNQANIYHFEFTDVPLVLGGNHYRFIVSSDFGGDEESLTLQYVPDGSDSLAPPTISDSNPPAGALINRSSFRVATQIESSAGPLQVEFNGQTLLTPDDGLTFYPLSQLVSFAVNQTEMVVEVRATDSLGKQTQRSFTYKYDAQAPVIVLDQIISPSPAVTLIDQASYSISGAVSDENLASLMINDQSIALQPGSSETSYTFASTIDLLSNEVTPVHLEAFDRSGNRTSLEYIFENSSPSTVTVLLPTNGAEFISSDTPIELQVVARIVGLVGGEKVVAYLQGQSDFAMLELNGTLASGNIQLPITSGEQTIVIELRDSSDIKITQDEIDISIRNEADIPLELIRIEPSNNARFIEPNAIIELYFNREIELNLLTVNIAETLHGKSYLNADPLGVDFVRAKGYTLNEINRDFEAVPGQVEIIPGNSAVSFSALRLFGFNAEVFVEVSYDGQQLSRSTFRVRELPTFINGAIVDQFGQPLADIQVELPALKRATTTNGDGGFAFGYQETGEQLIPGGRYKLLVNSGFANPRLGTIATTINVQQNYPNNLDRLTLQELDRSLPFYNISSGTVNSLAQGDLVIDLSGAQLLFANGRTSGAIHAQFLPFEHMGVLSWPSAIPTWVFGLQPKGVLVEGDVSVSLKIPMLRGSYDYIDFAVYQYVVMLGYNREGEVLEPIGVGKIENTRVNSVGKLQLTSLDYVGYAQIPPTFTDTLASYANGEITLQQLKALLITP